MSHYGGSGAKIGASGPQGLHFFHEQNTSTFQRLNSVDLKNCG